MLLLALDTSAGLGVALHDGDAVLAAHADPDPRHHVERLAPAVRDVLAAAGADRRDLTAIAVGVGPAPYTGLRVGLATALVLGEVLGIEVHGVVSLDALAATVLDQATPSERAALSGGFVVATDAKRAEVHWATYALPSGTRGTAAADVVRTDGPHVGAPQEVRSGLPCVGAGAQRYAHVLTALAGPLLTTVVAPGVLASLAVDRLRRGGELLAPEPLYLRRPDATEPSAPKPVLA